MEQEYRLEPLYRDGKQIMPQTVASAVMCEDGSTLADKLTKTWVSPYFDANTTSLTIPDINNYTHITLCLCPNNSRIVRTTEIPVSMFKTRIATEVNWALDGSIYYSARYVNDTTIELTCANWGGFVILSN